MNVFVIDDAPVNLRTYAKLLQTIEGLQVDAHPDAGSALKRAETTIPDLVIVDYRMPGMNGLEFIRRFRLMPQCDEVPVIMLTGERDIAIRRGAVTLGANDFLNKPADPVEFMARTRNLLALRQSRQELAQRAEQLAEEVRVATAQIVERQRETIHQLTRASEYRDVETGFHVVRMGKYAAILGRELGMSEDQQQLLLMAAPMHDVGKIAIPDRILLKPGRLTPDEWEIMKTHTTAGYEILRESNSPMLKMAAEIAWTHHERWDGKGYPRGLSGTAIPVSGRICALADVFDALSSVRPYKAEWPVEQVAVQIAQGRARQFDPAVVDAFESAFTEIRDVREALSDTLEFA